MIRPFEGSVKTSQFRKFNYPPFTVWHREIVHSLWFDLEEISNRTNNYYQSPEELRQKEKRPHLMFLYLLIRLRCVVRHDISISRPRFFATRPVASGVPDCKLIDVSVWRVQKSNIWETLCGPPPPLVLLIIVAGGFADNWPTCAKWTPRRAPQCHMVTVGMVSATRLKWD